jgi:hypothetical protein
MKAFAILGVIGAASAATAQPCERYWAGIDVRSIPGHRVLLLPTAVDPEGAAELVICAGMPDIPPGVTLPHRWTGQSWEPVSLKGVPPGTIAGYLYSLNSGDGERLCWRITNPVSNFGMYKLVDDQWSLIPGFWPEQGGYGTWSMNLWGERFILGDHQYHGVKRFTGTGWQTLGLHDGGYTQVAIGYRDPAGDATYIFSPFNNVAGVPARGFARFDGTTWTAPWPHLVRKGVGLADAVVYDDGSGPAIFTNYVPTIPGEPTDRQGLFKWNGLTWSFIGGPSGGNREIWDLQVFDDGRGPAVYIGGLFENFGGVVTDNLVRYSGTGFEAVGGGVQTPIKSMGVVRDERGLSLWIQSQHPFAQISVGGGTLTGFAQWVGCKEPACYANCDASTASPRLTANDFLCFLNKFVLRDPYANCDANASINAADFQCFLTRFAAGCP